MKKYRVILTVEAASGTQSIIVNAKSAQDAIDRCKKGEGEFEDEEVEVTSVGYPNVDEVHEFEEE